MSKAATEAVLREYCRELKMPAVLRTYPTLSRQAQDAGMPYEEFLRELLDAELCSRRESTANRRLKEARFPELRQVITHRKTGEGRQVQARGGEIRPNA